MQFMKCHVGKGTIHLFLNNLNSEDEFRGGSCLTVHIVQKGDTLWKIAKQYQIPFDEIKRLNAHLANPDYIVPGMEIFLPDTAKLNKAKKETPMDTKAMPTPQSPPKKEMPIPAPQTPPKKEMPVKEKPTSTPAPAPAPSVPPQAAPIQTQPPSWVPFPQPIPMPMPIPQQMPPIIMPQQPSAPQMIRIEHPPMPQQPVQPVPMQCPSCRMSIMIAMPQMHIKEEEKKPKTEPVKTEPVKTEPAKTEQKEQHYAPCVPTPPNMEQFAPWMQPAMPMPWGGGRCMSCHQPVHVPPSCSWPMHQPQFWPQPAEVPMQQPPFWSQPTEVPMQQPQFWPQANQCATNEQPPAMMPQVAGTEQWSPTDLKCEMQQHIVNQYYDEIREIEQSNRPCYPQVMPPMHMPYFQQ